MYICNQSTQTCEKCKKLKQELTDNYHYARSSDLQMATCDKTARDNRPNDTKEDMDKELDEATGDKKHSKAAEDLADS